MRKAPVMKSRGEDWTELTRLSGIGWWENETRVCRRLSAEQRENERVCGAGCTVGLGGNAELQMMTPPPPTWKLRFFTNKVHPSVSSSPASTPSSSPGAIDFPSPAAASTGYSCKKEAREY